MKERPILFSGPMVRSILAVEKTQTRRVVKPQPPNSDFSVASYEDWEADACSSGIKSVKFSTPFEQKDRWDWWPSGYKKIQCPYGKPGDRLWVRETWVELIDVDAVYRPGVGYLGSYPEDRPYLVPPTHENTGRNYVIWRADGEAEFCDGDGFCGEMADRDDMPVWRPSIHMPRWASRINLEVTGVRVERLQDISDADILAEGVTQELMLDLVQPGASKCKVLDEHWVHGGDEGLSYCHACCVKEVERLKAENPTGDYVVDGGWCIEGDSTAFCETCGHRLENSLTDYGAESEFEHFLENGLDLNSPDDCLSFYEALSSQLWTAEPEILSHSEFERKQWVKRVELMHRACWRVLWESINGPESWAANPWVWVVEFKLVKGGQAHV